MNLRSLVLLVLTPHFPPGDVSISVISFQVTPVVPPLHSSERWTRDTVHILFSTNGAESDHSDAEDEREVVSLIETDLPEDIQQEIESGKPSQWAVIKEV